MTNSKSEKVRNWLKEYLKEFKEYSGTIEELSNLAGASPYLIKKVLGELEEEGFIRAETKRGKGLVITLCEDKEEKKAGAAPQKEVEERVASEEKEEKKKEKKKSLQDQVLSSLLGKNVIVFLISGTRLEGVLLDFDNFTLAMTAPKGKSLVYKHAVATILFE
jgi:RNA chaperone Hfq